MLRVILTAVAKTMPVVGASGDDDSFSCWTSPADCKSAIIVGKDSIVWTVATALFFPAYFIVINLLFWVDFACCFWEKNAFCVCFVLS